MSSQLLYDKVVVGDKTLHKINAPNNYGSFIFNVDESKFTEDMKLELAGISILFYTEVDGLMAKINNRSVLWNTGKDLSIPVADLPTEFYISINIITNRTNNIEIEEFPISIIFESDEISEEGGRPSYSNLNLSIYKNSDNFDTLRLNDDDEEISSVVLPTLRDTSITMRLSNEMSSLNLDVDYIPSREFILKYNFSSQWNIDKVSTGPGTMILKVNNTEVHSENIVQGSNKINVMSYLEPNSVNTVEIAVTDSQNNIRSLIYKISTSTEINLWTVNFIVDGSIKQTVYVENNKSTKYTGEDIVIDNKYFEGWDTDLSSVTSDMNVNAVLSEKILPDEPADISLYDYVYSNDPNDKSAYTWGQLLAICESDDPFNYFSLGDKIKIVMKGGVLKDPYYRYAIADKNHFKKANSDEYAKVYFDLIDATVDQSQFNSSQTNVGGFALSKLYKTFVKLINSAYPDFVYNSITEVQYCRLNGNSLAETTVIQDKTVVPSLADMGFSVSYPYTLEIDSGSENRAFPIYTSNSSRIKKLYNGLGSSAWYWLSTPVTPGSSYVFGVYTAGSSTSNTANHTSSVALGFNLG